MFKNTRKWLSRWTWKKVFRISKKLLASFVKEQLEELEEKIKIDTSKEELLKAVKEIKERLGL